MEFGPNMLSFADSLSYYKVLGMHIKRDFDMYIIHRNTYDLLSFLGDIGGLIDILRIFGFILVGWVQK